MAYHGHKNSSPANIFRPHRGKVQVARSPCSLSILTPCFVIGYTSRSSARKYRKKSVERWGSDR
jgi:hypothetical protein